MSKAVKIFAACCRVGQLKRGVEKGPVILLHNLYTQGLLKNIYSEYIHDREFFFPNTGYNKLYDKNKNCLESGNSPLTIGGDHSVGRATVAAAASVYEDRTHIIWVDAHADIHTPMTSNSGNTHGMPVSNLLGMTNMMNIESYILKPSQFTYIGLRDVEEEEQKLLDSLDMQVFTSEDVRNIGIENVMDEVTETKLDSETAVHISLDVDAVDPKYLYSTGTRVKDGLCIDDVSHIIGSVKTNLISADIVEFNPKIGNKHQRAYSTDTACRMVNEMMDALM
tara:strand:- start:416 stop:1255 length:840 start_codon:yes stop_codon:yes gene_type:complete